MSFPGRAASRYAISTAALTAVVVICRQLIQGNATTAALLLLLVVLGGATGWGLGVGIFSSFAGVLCLNYFFLPPVGKLTIADPQNWIALLVFLATAITASQLSSSVRQRASEATAGRDEIQKLYELSRALLMEDESEAMRHAVVRAGQILQMPAIAFFDVATGAVYGTLDSTRVERTDLENVARNSVALEKHGLHIVPVRLGGEAIGSLVMETGVVSTTAMDSVASLLAIGYERTKALDRAAAAEVARRNEEFRSSLLDGLAHDLKTPLTAIRSCVTRLITIPPKKDEVRQELLSIIDEESDRLQRTISEAIELARIESKELHLDRQKTTMAELLERTLSALRDENPLRYELTFPPELEVSANLELLPRALLHILENARRYSPVNSPIRIAAREDADAIAIRVTDGGPGFDAAEVDRLFEKFFRGKQGRLYTGGTGMGLAIARGIVEAHGGKIRAANAPGGGAVISILLPRSTI